MVLRPTHHDHFEQHPLFYDICTRQDKCYHPRKLVRVSLIERYPEAYPSSSLGYAVSAAVVMLRAELVDTDWYSH